ncbi:hypothetical protein [Sphaerisporangium sp. TRM90804]|uniref:hypothetical protein n=1 Tax=Sphaerisporangium sp. TRM90804 TaxID=3031113 RepID=UPI00244BCE28|nr:hypothetical protein [Sphaerisporangium sp. TRM90804]MDH2427689.1 hypothetical protein [Sphaerisporangium sp. TRM90804]
MSRSCLLRADVEDTPVADPGNEPWPGGNIAQLRALGLHVDDIVEETAARMPTPEEAALLDIGAGAGVRDHAADVRERQGGGGADPIAVPGDRAVRVDRIVL